MQTNEPERVEVVFEKDSMMALTKAGPHQVIVDEPVPYGSNMGPDPYDLLLSALGACTAVTMRMYANRKGWPLGKITVILSHRKVHPEDCEHCEEENAKLDRIEKQIILEGDLTPEQKARIKGIGDKCPVHKTLMAGVSVYSELITQ